MSYNICRCLTLKNILKSLTIIVAAFLALILTRIGISYLFILVALGIIIPFITEDKRSAVISGALYAIISYMLSYPSGLFLINYMPKIDIPIKVSFAEVIFNLFMGLLIPVIIAAVICFISAIIGKYLSQLFKQYVGNNNTKKDENKHSFNYNKDFEENIETNNKEVKYHTRKRLDELSPIQKAKNRRKYEE